MTYSMDTKEQKLATKDPKTDEQFIITREYMMNFIKENDKLNDMLYKLRIVSIILCTFENPSLYEMLT